MELIAISPRTVKFCIKVDKVFSKSVLSKEGKKELKHFSHFFPSKLLVEETTLYVLNKNSKDFVYCISFFKLID